MKNICQSSEMDKKVELKKINLEIVRCKKCHLWKARKKSVPGEGNPKADIFLTGEAPGYFEDQEGRPFVGAAGKLLDKLIFSIKLRRKDVFISNVLHCRPPNNREPEREEIEACRGYLFRQIEAIKPKIIITLGRFSMNLFIPDGKITQIHGQARWFNLGKLRLAIVPMFHPAAALRNGEVLKKIKEDFQKIPKILSSFDNQTGSSSINRSSKKTEQLAIC